LIGCQTDKETNETTKHSLAVGQVRLIAGGHSPPLGRGDSRGGGGGVATVTEGGGGGGHRCCHPPRRRGVLVPGRHADGAAVARALLVGAVVLVPPLLQTRALLGAGRLPLAAPRPRLVPAPTAAALLTDRQTTC